MKPGTRASHDTSTGPSPESTAPDAFWSRVRKTDHCWVWLTADGDVAGSYGVYQKTGAHRVAWSLENGPIPRGALVLHHCDTPSCVRPSHLFIGTTQDNIRDYHEKRRAGVLADGWYCRDCFEPVEISSRFAERRYASHPGNAA